MQEPQLKLVNGHYQLRCQRPINLQRLSDIVGANGKLHRGRPTMLICRMKTKRVQFFPNGTVQILGGGVTPFLLHHLTFQISHILHQCNLTLPPPILRWKVNNLVFHFDFMTRIKFTKCLCTKDFSYEPELFPAALISKWHPAHVTVFSNGKGMITGVKTHDEALYILHQLPSFLSCITK